MPIDGPTGNLRAGFAVDRHFSSTTITPPLCLIVVLAWSIPFGPRSTFLLGLILFCYLWRTLFTWSPTFSNSGLGVELWRRYRTHSLQT
jgi:predicted MFS family arabinose efflux permease